MKQHKITCIQDVRDLQKTFDNDDSFKVIETGETITLSELLFGYDRQQITLEYIAQK